MSKHGAATAIGFYLGLKDDVTPSLKKIERGYDSLLNRILKGNEKVQKGLKSAAKTTAGSGTRMTAAGIPKKFNLDLAPRKASEGFLRKLFGNLVGNQSQRYSGRLTPLAKGGVVTKPTGALVGEKGAEAVMPLRKFATMIRNSFMDALERHKGGMNRKEQARAKWMRGKNFSEESIARALEKGRKSADGIEKAMDKANVKVSAILGLLSLESIRRGIEGAQTAQDWITDGQSYRSMTTKGGFSREDRTELWKSLSKQNQAGLTTSRGQVSAAGGLIDSGMRREDVKNMAASGVLAMIDSMRNAFQINSESVFFHMNRAARMDAQTSGEVAKTMAHISRTRGVSFDQMSEQITQSTLRFQDALADTSMMARKTILQDMSAVVGAFQHELLRFDASEMLDALTVAPDAIGSRARLAAGMGGISEQDILDILKTQGIGGLFEAGDHGLLGALDNIAGGAADASVQARILGDLFGEAFQVSGTQVLRFGNMQDDVLKRYRSSMEDAVDINNVYDQSVTDVTSSVRRWMRITKNAIETFDGFGVLPLSIGEALMLTREFDFLAIGQGIFGISIAIQGLTKVLAILRYGLVAVGVVGKGLLVATTFLPMLMFKGAAASVLWAKSLFGLAAAQKTAAVASTGMTLSFKGVLLGFAAVGKGIAMLLLGIGIGIAKFGALLLNPVGAAGLLGIGVLTLAVIGLGYALKLAAPAITALLSGIAEVVGTTLGAFAQMDVVQMLAAGPAMAAMGLGFSAMAAGVVAGIALLTAGDLSSKFASFFGVGKGSVGETLTAFVNDMVPLANVMTSMKSLGGSGTFRIPIPTFDGNMANIRADLALAKEVYGEMGSLIPTIRAASNMPSKINIPTPSVPMEVIPRVNAEDLQEMMRLVMSMMPFGDDEVIEVLRDIRDRLSPGNNRHESYHESLIRTGRAR